MTSVMLFVPFFCLSTLQSTQFIRLLFSALKKKKQTNSSQLNSSEKNLIKMTEFLGRLCVSGATRVGICDRLFSGFGTKAIQQQSVRLAHSRGAMRMYSVLDKKLNTKMQPCLKNSS